MYDLAKSRRFVYDLCRLALDLAISNAENLAHTEAALFLAWTSLEFEEAWS